MNLRQAAELALEALESFQQSIGVFRGEFEEEVAALRAALAEPEPLGWITAGRHTAPLRTHWEGCEAVHPECKALPEPTCKDGLQVDAVAWHHPECTGECIACLIDEAVKSAYGTQGLSYLHRHIAAPTPRKPLTDEEIQTIWAKTFEMGSSANTFARAIEKAHGIKEQERE